MREIYLSGYNNFILPFMIGMIFVLSYCAVGAVRIILQLNVQDRRKFFRSLVNPRIMTRNIRDWFCDCLFHVKLWKRNKMLGYMHSSIAFGWFMLIVIGHLEVLLYTPERVNQLWYPIFFRYFVAETESTMRGAFLFFLMDFFLLVVLSGIILAIVKRIHSRIFGMKRTTRPSFADMVGMYALWCIFPLRLLAEGFTAGISGGSFLTKSLHWVLNSFLSDHMNMLPTWWAYSISLGVFMCALPFSRYMHIPAEILLIPLRNAGLTIRNARKGFARIQVYSCPGCGVCIDACPMGVIRANSKDATVYLNRQIRRGNESRIEEISDKCLLCGKCTNVCQVGVEGDKLRIAQRSLRQYGYTPDYSNISIKYTENSINKNVINANNFVLNTTNEKVVYFQGCMTALTPSISNSVEKILRNCGIDYIFADKHDGLCCGRPLMTSGRKEAAMQLIEKNTELIRSTGATILLLSCPICYRIYKEKYDLEGIRVMHHSEFIDQLAASGRLHLKKSSIRYVYHDPCDLGRGCGIYEQPRSLINRVGTLVKAAQEKDQSICCGGSLGSITLNFEQRGQIAESAIRSLTAENPDAIVTGCPLCKSTFARHGKKPVKDIAEIVCEGMTD